MKCFLRTLFIFQIFLHVHPFNHTWWKHALIYQIYPRSFKDSNNDGIGDLNGIISKLDFLKNTGMDAVWLSPIYKSPQVDQGYDVSDYTSIDPDYGTMEDFDELIKQSKDLGLRIVMDFVPNHSSNQHIWFNKSESGDPEFRDFYVWRKGREGGRYPPNNWLSLFGGPAWTYSPLRQEYYLHQFTKEQPDLNLRNPKVVEEMKKILKFWLDKGVSGFRMDAVKHLVEDALFRDEPLKKDKKKAEGYQDLQHIYTIDQEETFAVIYEWRNFIDEYSRDSSLHDTKVIMTEATSDLCTTMKYYGNHTHKGSHFTFNFYFITDVKKESMAKDIKRVVDMWMNSIPAHNVPNWVIGSHDEHRVASRFGAENIDGFNMLNLLLPGVAITYNGEEIGQENGQVTFQEGKDPSACHSPVSRFDQISRDFQRTPYQWDNTTNAGFNKGEKTWLPIGKQYKTVNLKQQLTEEKSHYNIYTELTKLRKEEEFRRGDLTIERVARDVVVLSRSYNNQTYFVIFNVGNHRVWTHLDLFETTEKLKVVISSDKSYRKKNDLIKTSGFHLDPHESLVVLTTSDGVRYVLSSMVLTITLFIKMVLF